MAGDGIGAAEAKLRGDFLRRRHIAVCLLPFLNKIEYLLLSSSQSFHSVYLDTIVLRPDVKQELFTQMVGLAGNLGATELSLNLHGATASHSRSATARQELGKKVF